MRTPLLLTVFLPNEIVPLMKQRVRESFDMDDRDLVSNKKLARWLSLNLACDIFGEGNGTPGGDRLGDAGVVVGLSEYRNK